MRRNILLLIAVALLIAGLTLLSDTLSMPVKESPEPAQTAVAATNPAPDFSFMPLYDGRAEVRLQDLKGRVVLLHFWASWCAPCVIEFPALQNLARANQDWLTVIAVTPDTEQDLRKFFNKVGRKDLPNFMIVMDTNKEISQDLFQTIKLPETIVINPRGSMVRKIAGATDWADKELLFSLSSLAAQ